MLSQKAKGILEDKENNYNDMYKKSKQLMTVDHQSPIHRKQFDRLETKEVGLKRVKIKQQTPKVHDKRKQFVSIHAFVMS